tara:strand:- start:517 stop:921 length:405 start_codon:yes stop_codon:yes gene_type:complete
MILTPHFNKKEFASRDGAGMPEDVWQNIKILASQLEVLRSHLNKPISVTSGFRSETHNNRIGGKKNSQHLLGKASDLQVKGLKPKKVYDAIEKLISQGKMLQGGLGLYDTFVHYDIRGEEARWNNSTKDEQKAV